MPGFVRHSIRHSILRWSLLLAALVTLLPPGAWSLCVDPTGHKALEPTATACADIDTPVDACGSTSHDECVDYVLSSGHLTTTPSSTSLHEAPLSGAIERVEPSPLLSIAPAAVASLLLHAPPALGAPSILRC